MLTLSFQTREILKSATSALEGESWIFSEALGRPERYNYTVAHQRTIPGVIEEAEFGSIITTSAFGQPTSLANAFNSLLVLQDMVEMILSSQNSAYDERRVFFSTLESLCTISDCILRKLRGFLMVVSLDCTKLELLGEGGEKSLPNKPKGKLSACSRRKKGRIRNMKKVSPFPRSV